MSEVSSIILSQLNESGWSVVPKSPVSRTVEIATLVRKTSNTLTQAKAYLEPVDGKLRLSGYHNTLGRKIMRLRSKVFLPASNINADEISVIVKLFCEEVKSPNRRTR